MGNKVTTGKRAEQKAAARLKPGGTAPVKKPEAAKPVARKVKPAEETVDKRKPAVAKAVPVAVVPPKGKPGRKPKAPAEEPAIAAETADAVPEAGDDTVDESVQVAEKMTPRQRAKDRRAKEKALQEALKRMPPGPQEDFEARRNKLKALIKLGRERGFLTYSEINDHLPDNLVDAEAIDAIISTFSDMGIQVFDQAPDAETLLMTENAPAATSSDDAEEEAEAALSNVDTEFGRTTDPVRMYMREMGSVELLTREGEIEIAKRIEDGLKHMVMAISACPTTIAEILEHADRIGAASTPIDEVVDGLVDEAEGFPSAAASSGEDEDDEGEETTDLGARRSSRPCASCSTRCACPSRRRDTSRPATSRRRRRSSTS